MEIDQSAEIFRVNQNKSGDANARKRQNMNENKRMSERDMRV